MNSFLFFLLFNSSVVYFDGFDSDLDIYGRPLFSDIISESGNNILKLDFFGGSNGSNRYLSNIQLPKNMDQAYLSFKVKFPKDFMWVKGGKLFGLGPKKAVVAGQKVVSQGWSLRLMFKPFGKVSAYNYFQNKNIKWGDGSQSAYSVFSDGEWHKLDYFIKLNDYSDDGYYFLCVDGHKIIEQRGIKFRSSFSYDSLINNLLFHSFYGGHTPEWAPVVNGQYSRTHFFIDDIYVLDLGNQGCLSEKRLYETFF